MVSLGYKKTEVGEIPEDWDVEPLEEFTKYISYGFTNPMPCVSNGIYMVTAKDINIGRIQYESTRHTTELAYKSLLTAKSRPKKNDVLLTKDGSLGRLALVGSQTICINQSVALLRPNARILPKFFKVLLESPYYQSKMVDDAGGTTIKHIYITIVNKMILGVPRLVSEQTAIATALTDIDNLIISLETLIAKKRDIKTATMQQLLTGKKRLPGFGEGKGMKQTELGEIPEDWEVKELGQFGNFKKGKGIKKDQVIEDGKPCIRYGEIYTKHHDYIKEFYSYIPIAVAMESTKISNGDLLFSGSGETAEEIGKCVSYLWNSEAYAGGDIVIFSPIGQCSKYLGYLMNHASVVTQKARMGQGDAVVHIHAPHLAQLKLCLPCAAEQKAIADLLSDIDMAIALIDKKLSKVKSIKQGMMQELLTGRTRLVDVPVASDEKEEEQRRHGT